MQSRFSAIESTCPLISSTRMVFQICTLFTIILYLNAIYTFQAQIDSICQILNIIIAIIIIIIVIIKMIANYIHMEVYPHGIAVWCIWNIYLTTNIFTILSHMQWQWHKAQHSYSTTRTLSYKSYIRKHTQNWARSRVIHFQVKKLQMAWSMVNGHIEFNAQFKHKNEIN